MRIPYHLLAPETLRAVIENFVEREGTDYGEKEWSLEEKVEQVLQQIKIGKAVIVYDEKTETCNILTREEFLLHGEE